MKLAERRVVDEFQKNDFLIYQEKIRQYTHAPLEVDWESLCIEGQAHLFLEAWKAVYFEPLVEGIAEVGRDDMGKTCLKNDLRKIVIQNKNERYNYDNWASFADGTLTLDHLPTTNLDDAESRKKSSVKLLESSM